MKKGKYLLLSVILIFCLSILSSCANSTTLVEKMEGKWERPSDTDKNTMLQLTIHATGENTFHLREDFMNPLVRDPLIASRDYTAIDGSSFVETRDLDHQSYFLYDIVISVKFSGNKMYLINSSYSEDDQPWTRVK